MRNWTTEDKDDGRIGVPVEKYVWPLNSKMFAGDPFQRYASESCVLISSGKRKSQMFNMKHLNGL